MSEQELIRGEAAGVPFVPLTPLSGRASAPAIFVWHLHDPPRSETAMAAALPLNSVDASRAYLGLPLSGKRLLAGGLDGFYALGYEDAVLKLYAPTVHQAVEEFPSALNELRRRLGVTQGEIAFVGASIGAFVAASIVAAGEPAATALALVSPALRLAAVVAANERRFQVSYDWSDEARAGACETWRSDVSDRRGRRRRGRHPTRPSSSATRSYGMASTPRFAASLAWPTPSRMSRASNLRRRRLPQPPSTSCSRAG